jgi:hypothetical protein
VEASKGSVGESLKTTEAELSADADHPPEPKSLMSSDIKDMYLTLSSSGYTLIGCSENMLVAYKFDGLVICLPLNYYTKIEGRVGLIHLPSQNRPI